MAIYTDLAALQTRDSVRDLAQVTSNTDDTIDEQVVAQAVTIAQAVVDSYIEERIEPWPLTQVRVSEQIKHAALVIARWYLYADKKTEAVEREYMEVMQWLRDVAAGRASSGVVNILDDGSLVTGTFVVAPVAKPLFGPAFEALYDVPMGPNGFGAFNSGSRNGFDY